MKNEFKIVHLFNDEKFIDSAITLFEEVYPNNSIYYVLQSKNEPFKHIRCEKVKPFLIEKVGDENKILNVFEKNKIDVVFFHGLGLKKQRIVNVLDKEVLKVWFIWGYDLYWNWKLLKQKMFERETFFFMYGKESKTSFRKNILFNNFTLGLFTQYRNKKIRLPKVLVKKLENQFMSDFYKIVQEVDIVAPIVPPEFDYVKRINPKLVFAPFQYGNLENLAIDTSIFDIKDANNILIGNSASPTNNHVDAFKQVLKYKQYDQKIIVPLSYGGSPEYLKFVTQKGNDYFGDDFVPILNFMPLNDYKELISSCGFAVFNHKRQEALGNINTMGYYGAKIFLNKESPIFKYFKKLDIHVFNINGINKYSLGSSLSKKEIENNRSILYKLYSKEAENNKVLEMLQIVGLKLKEN